MIIPVLDLLHGQVVHAIDGKRDRYRPLECDLCKTSDPIEVVSALLEIYPFEIIYIADLNAIENNGNNTHVITRLASHFPTVTLWLDAGISSPLQITTHPASGYRIQWVIGSESLPDISDVKNLMSDRHEQASILSLDFRNGSFLGPAKLLTAVSCWPEQIIVMSLDRVGNNKGPDIARLSMMRRRAPGQNFFAAGGVRNLIDLKTLYDAGIRGALLASALYSGLLGYAEITEAVEWPKPFPEA